MSNKDAAQLVPFFFTSEIVQLAFAVLLLYVRLPHSIEEVSPLAR